MSFWNLVYDERQWSQERRGAYEQLSLFSEADAVRTKLSQEFDLVARRLNQGLSQNSFVTLRDRELHLKRPDAARESPQQGARRILEQHGSLSGNPTTATLEVIALSSQAEIDRLFAADKRGLVVKLLDLAKTASNGKSLL